MIMIRTITLFILIILNTRFSHANTCKEYPVLANPVYNPGMFCVLNTVVWFLYQYNLGNFAGFEIDFAEGGLYYDKDKGPNWWSYYFEEVKLGDPKKGVIKNYGGQDLINQDHFTQKNLKRHQVFNLIQKYIRPKKTILEKIKKFTYKNFKNYFVIGIHYRGTDKFQEAPRVTYEEVLEALNKIVDDRYDFRIFVATDEKQFLEFLLSKYPSNIVYQDMERSSDGTPIHLDPLTSRYKMGEEALIDCLILSKTNLLIRTDSRLSLWSAYFNPEVPVITLNSNYYLGRSPDGL